ncbi:MAG: lycopene cyclase family protein [Cytophagales bacterium]|nr:lycopene cyclase family protein [Cytophagales bacterium]
MLDTDSIKPFDYIIAGSGLAGLSLLHHLLLSDQLNKKEILVLDLATKNQNDRTWCYWESEASVFDSAAIKSWDTLQFISPSVDKTFKLKAYRYKMIRGIDFYQYVLDHATAFENVTFRNEAIEEILEEDGQPLVKTDQQTYRAEYIFNSTGLFHPKMSPDDTLLQHFMGWNIKSEKPAFDPTQATLMDFRPSQKHGTTFMYVLPITETEALVEYTLFTPEVLEKEAYVKALEAYLSNQLQLESYKIEHEEYGIIPMSLARFQKQVGSQKRIINLGTAGGYTKASTGYTFQFVQRHVRAIIKLLSQGQPPIMERTFRDKMFDWYDRTLLDVLLSEKMTGEEIFTSLFKKTDPELILAFLDNKSGFWKEFIIRNSVPQIPFMTSGMKQLFSR